MELVKVFLTALGSAVVLFFLTKIMGNREMSQLSMFDFVTAITIGSIAAEMATELEKFEKPLVAMTVYALLSILISYINCKSIKARRFLSGKALILFEDGEIYEKNLQKARLDVNEFLTQCRIQGYFNIDNLEIAILEQNGKISFLPKSIRRPVTAEDLNLNPPPTEDKPIINVIIDGEIMYENLKITGNSEKWLKQQLLNQGITDLSKIFLATCNSKNNMRVYLKNNKKITHDIFQ